MNSIARLLLIALLFSSVNALALPPRQHLVIGNVVSIDRDAIALVRARPENDRPASFAIKKGRTRFRKDGMKASKEQLPIGQSVRLYYKKELGVWVATEVGWKSREPTQK